MITSLCPAQTPALQFADAAVDIVARGLAPRALGCCVLGRRAGGLRCNVAPQLESRRSSGLLSAAITMCHITEHANVCISVERTQLLRFSAGRHHTYTHLI